MRKLVFISILVLAGCAGPQRPQVSAADDPSTPCFKSMETQPRFVVLTPHLMINNPDAASLEMLNDHSKPTDEEKRALSLWASQRNACVEMGSEFRRQNFPAVVPVYDDVILGVQHLISNLYAEKITYGEFNTERQVNAQRYRTQLAELRRQARGELAARQEAQRASNAQAAQTMLLMQAMQPRPVYVPQPPVITPSVNCTSYRTGNVTNTNCF